MRRSSLKNRSPFKNDFIVGKMVKGQESKEDKEGFHSHRTELLSRRHTSYELMCGFRGGGAGGIDPSLKNHKNIGSLSNTGPDPLKITILCSQHSMLGHHRHASETLFKWRFAGGPMMA